MRLQVAGHVLLPHCPIDVLHGPIAAIAVAVSSARNGREDFGRSDRIRAENKGDRVIEYTLVLEVRPEWTV